MLATGCHVSPLLHTNEDRHFVLDGGKFSFFGVFDGHDGPRAAGYTYLMEQFSRKNEEFFSASKKDFFKSIKAGIDEKVSLQAIIPKKDELSPQLQLQATLASTHNGSFLWRVPRKRYDVEDLSLKELVQLPVAAKWYELGIQLGVPTSKLKEFQVNYPNRAQLYLDDMFDWWLMNGESPTHSQLAEALEAIDRRHLAKKFRSQSKKAVPEGEKKSGFRKLWGAMKSCTTNFVEGFLEKLGSLADGLGIRRRYKKRNDVERWWFELEAEENDLQALECSRSGRSCKPVQAGSWGHVSWLRPKLF